MRQPQLFGRVAIVSSRVNQTGQTCCMVIIMKERIAVFATCSFEFLTYQLPSVGYWLTEAVTGNGELGFDSGEGA